MDKFSAIKRDLQTLRDSKKAPQMFGDQTHRYHLNAPLSETELQDFEARYKVELPHDYREFLRVVGNGGAGPLYGLFRLGEMDDGHDYGPWGEFIGDLSQPFPHTQSWNELPDGEPPFEGEEDSAEEDAYWERAYATEEIYWNAANMNGAMPICHLGCALRLWLVVSGHERDNIWEDNRVDGAGIQPLQSATQTHVNFFDWYRGWLDEALTKIEN